MADVAHGQAIVSGLRRDQGGFYAMPYMLAGPAFILMLLLLIGPVLAVVLLSFTDYQLGASAVEFIGVDNYKELIAEKVFWKALGNTLIYVGIVVPSSVGLGLGVALLIEGGKSWRAFYRAAFFLPVMATLIAMSIVWEFMLHPQFGLINMIIRDFGFPAQNWLNDTALALPVLAVIGSGSPSASIWYCSSPALCRSRGFSTRQRRLMAPAMPGIASVWLPGRCWGR